MSSPKRSPARRLRYALETVLAYAVYGIFWILPLDAASATGGLIGRLAGPRLRATDIARHNLHGAFPEKTEAEREEILRGMWDNLGRVAAEYPHLRRLWKRVALVGGEHIEAARDSGRPAIFFSGHLSNWEVCPIVARRTGLDISVVYRKPNNPGVDGLLRHARNAGATGHIEKGAEGAREMLAVLRKNGALAILADQKLNEGIAVPFFGRDAMTAPALAHFALHFDAPVYPVRIERLGGAHFRVTVLPPLEVPRSGDRKEDTRRIMTDINQQLESWIRARPAQWLWVHRRWKD